jgi:hypothetical protein
MRDDKKHAVAYTFRCRQQRYHHEDHTDTMSTYNKLDKLRFYIIILSYRFTGCPKLPFFNQNSTNHSAQIEHHKLPANNQSTMATELEMYFQQAWNKHGSWLGILQEGAYDFEYPVNVELSNHGDNQGTELRNGRHG